MKTPKDAKCGCGAALSPSLVRPVDAAWGPGDYVGALGVRLGIGRSNYRVMPGLYFLGAPDSAAPVFVTANYKLTFDHVRRALTTMSAWLLVLDTKGVNVWCAAAKGTFSTAELCRRIQDTSLADKVGHRRLILPQLGAPGVAAHEVTKATGFKVEYGPVRAADIPAWLAAGRKKDEAMRSVRFDFVDRLTLVPLEIHNALAFAPTLIAVALVLAIVRDRGVTSGFVAFFSAYAIELFGAVVLTGLLVPVLLPWLPSRAFSAKGAMVGLGWASAMIWVASTGAPAWFGSAFHGEFTAAGAVLLLAGYAAYLALNFTGATVFTSQSGTMRETKRALPFIGIASGLGLALQTMGAVLGEPP